MTIKLSKFTCASHVVCKQYYTTCDYNFINILAIPMFLFNVIRIIYLKVQIKPLSHQNIQIKKKECQKERRVKQRTIHVYFTF